MDRKLEETRKTTIPQVYEVAEGGTKTRAELREEYQKVSYGVREMITLDDFCRLRKIYKE